MQNETQSVKKDTEIEKEIDNLAYAVGNSNEGLTRLESAFKSVLRPQGPAKPEEKSAECPITELGQKIFGLKNQIRNQNAFIEDIVSRCAL